ncbi:AbrB/MazE/SpoVT family DNA-binding domain-containing protein [Thermococcus siculi]|uniref:AbrB/MazE/SpoVT family DNA-binding domain-containing protein n=1 Tax=Thermococcus siculi TaxID=72803 RepID=UPI001E5C2EFA|nr:AbrB/MazE/SpoVT family DNA-binding domain-containing protein [Thermococcus siculi]
MYTRLYHDLDVGDYVELIIKAKVSDEVLCGMFIARLVDKGNITIPKGLRDAMHLEKDSIVEVIVAKAYRLNELLGDRAEIIRHLSLSKYHLDDLSPDEELKLFSE